uniref:(northern house mosquito) hypothetical protein n=1 Tax=Culex pipiens TaxID=7175 RepID=A0A8D8A4S3_CULPI
MLQRRRGRGRLTLLLELLAESAADAGRAGRVDGHEGGVDAAFLLERPEYLAAAVLDGLLRHPGRVGHVLERRHAILLRKHLRRGTFSQRRRSVAQRSVGRRRGVIVDDQLRRFQVP